MSMLIEKCLTLSTAHMPPPGHEYFDDFGVRSEPHEYGTFVFFGGWPEVENMPAWIRPIYKYARTHKCVIVNFDRDVEACDRFKVYDW